jgi:lysophospholipase L1-like esterase
MFRPDTDGPVGTVTIRTVRRLRVVFVQLLLILIVGEALLHIYNPLPFRVRGNRIVLPVHQRYTFHNDGVRKLDAVTHNSRNSLGFRGPEPPKDLSTRLSVVTIGGSTTECLFLTDGKTWTDRLAQTLAPKFPDLWVNNAGLDGQSTYGHLILLRDFVDDLHPRVAVFLIGANDIGLDAGNPYDASLTPPQSAARAAVAFLTDHIELAGLAQNVVRVARARSGGFGHGEIDLRTIRHLEHDPANTAATIAKFSTSLPAFAARVAMIIEECRRHGIEPVLVTQPWLNGDAIDPTTGVNLATIQVRGPANGRLWWQVQELYNDVTRRAAAADGVLLIDAARELPKDSRYFYDFMHYTNEGAARLGDIVASHLAPHLRSLR